MVCSPTRRFPYSNILWVIAGRFPLVIQQNPYWNGFYIDLLLSCSHFFKLSLKDNLFTNWKAFLLPDQWSHKILNNTIKHLLKLSSKECCNIPYLDQTDCTGSRQERCSLSLWEGLIPRHKALRMMQAALQTVLKSDAEGKECHGLNSFLCPLDCNNIFWAQKGMYFPQQQLLQLSIVLS